MAALFSTCVALATASAHAAGAPLEAIQIAGVELNETGAVVAALKAFFSPTTLEHKTASDSKVQLWKVGAGAGSRSIIMHLIGSVDGLRSLGGAVSLITSYSPPPFARLNVHKLSITQALDKNAALIGRGAIVVLTSRTSPLTGLTMDELREVVSCRDRTFGSMTRHGSGVPTNLARLDRVVPKIADADEAVREITKLLIGKPGSCANTRETSTDLIELTAGTREPGGNTNTILIVTYDAWRRALMPNNGRSGQWRPLSIGCVRDQLHPPESAAIRDGLYPLFYDIFLYSKGDLSGDSSEFLRYIQSSRDKRQEARGRDSWPTVLFDETRPLVDPYAMSPMPRASSHTQEWLPWPIEFEPNSAELSPRGRASLCRTANWAIAHRVHRAEFLFRGHSDRSERQGVQGRIYNRETLPCNRARVVRDLLRDFGVAGTGDGQIEAVGTNEARHNRFAPRRVDVWVRRPDTRPPPSKPPAPARPSNVGEC